MKRLALACLAALLATGCDDNPTAPSNPNVLVMTANLSAANEVPPISNAENGARGDVRITFDLTRDGSGTITGGLAHFLVNLSNFPPNSRAVAAHIHEGAAGVAGGVRIGIPGTMLSATNAVGMPDGSASNVIFNSVPINTDATTLNALNAMLANPGNFYFNVHTPLNPGGAVRGQLTRE